MPAASTAMALLPITRFVAWHTGGGSFADRGPEPLEDGRRNARLARGELLKHGQRPLRRGTVDHRRAGADQIQRIAGHVGDDQRKQLCRTASPSNPPPLMRLSCLRTVFNCSILAPAALRCRVTASLSASVIASTGVAAGPSRPGNQADAKSSATAIRPAVGFARAGRAPASARSSPPAAPRADETLAAGVHNRPAR